MAKEQKVEYHKWLKDDTVKVKLMKMSKGYQWELTYESEDLQEAIDRIQEADLKLRELYVRELYGAKEE